MVERVCVAKAITSGGVFFERQNHYAPRLIEIDVKRPSGESLVHLRLKANTLAEDLECLVAVVQTPIPEGNDGIEVCDGCGWPQYVFHGYTMDAGELPVHVSSLCLSCGGQPQEEVRENGLWDDDEV